MTTYLEQLKKLQKAKPRTKAAVVKFPRTCTAGVHRGTVTVCVLRIDGQRLSRALFRQIPAVVLETWPAWHDILGWVSFDGDRWLVWSDDGRLVRSDVRDWRFRDKGTEVPVTDRVRQVYLI